MFTAAVVRAQPVVPLLLVTLRLKPPEKNPQLTPAAFSRSPIFFPPMLTFALADEHTSLAGSSSPISVYPLCPSATPPDAAPAVYVATPFVWPATRFSAP